MSGALHGGGGQGAVLCPLHGDLPGRQDVQLGPLVGGAGGGAGGVCSLHQQGGQ